jgi:hypothetical protein
MYGPLMTRESATYTVQRDTKYTTMQSMTSESHVYYTVHDTKYTVHM